jgi:hypothetical protein
MKQRRRDDHHHHQMQRRSLDRLEKGTCNLSGYLREDADVMPWIKLFEHILN